MDFDDDIDAIGLLCPLPVMKARKRLHGLQPGQIVRLQTDDPAARIDVPHFCNEQGHELIETLRAGEAWQFLIRKSGQTPQSGA